MWRLIEWLFGKKGKKKEEKPRWTLVKADGTQHSFKKRPMRMMFKRDLF